jgi:2,4-dichlorophenol 6-monooxygenase
MNRKVQVTICGGGPSGLVLSSLLSRYGVPNLVLERAVDPPKLPRAHFINLRSMEVCRHALSGLDSQIIARMPPLEQWR